MICIDWLSLGHAGRACCTVQWGTDLRYFSASHPSSARSSSGVRNSIGAGRRRTLQHQGQAVNHCRATLRKIVPRQQSHARDQRDGGVVESLAVPGREPLARAPCPRPRPARRVRETPRDRGTANPAWRFAGRQGRWRYRAPPRVRTAGIGRPRQARATPRCPLGAHAQGCRKPAFDLEHQLLCGRAILRADHDTMVAEHEDVRRPGEDGVNSPSQRHARPGIRHPRPVQARQFLAQNDLRVAADGDSDGVHRMGVNYDAMGKRGVHGRLDRRFERRALRIDHA